MRFTVEQNVEGDPFALLCRLSALRIGADNGCLVEVRKVEVTDTGEVLVTYDLPTGELELLPAGSSGYGPISPRG